MASPKRAAAVFDAARARGVPDEQLARVKAPAGIEIGAETLEEVAVSIMAEIVQVRRRPKVESCVCLSLGRWTRPRVWHDCRGFRRRASDRMRSVGLCISARSTAAPRSSAIPPATPRPFCHDPFRVGPGAGGRRPRAASAGPSSCSPGATRRCSAGSFARPCWRRGSTSW